jgi:hypothetical protein
MVAILKPPIAFVPLEIIRKILEQVCAHCAHDFTGDSDIPLEEQHRLLEESQKGLENLKEWARKVRLPKIVPVIEEFLYHMPVKRVPFSTRGREYRWDSGRRDWGLSQGSHQRTYEFRGLMTQIGFGGMARHLRRLTLLDPNTRPRDGTAEDFIWRIGHDLPLTGPLEVVPAGYFTPSVLLQEVDASVYPQFTKDSEYALFLTRALQEVSFRFCDTSVMPDMFEFPLLRLRTVNAIGRFPLKRQAGEAFAGEAFASLEKISSFIEDSPGVRLLRCDTIRIDNRALPTPMVTHLSLKNVDISPGVVSSLFKTLFPLVQILELDECAIRNRLRRRRKNVRKLMAALAPIKNSLQHLRLSSSRAFPLSIKSLIRNLTGLQTLELEGR